MNITSSSVQETLRFGKRIARHVHKGDIICLFGDLGSGKTVLTKGISQGLGIKKNDVLSPTFVLMRRYEGRLPVFHFDLYRLKDAGDIFDLGYEEYLYDNGVAVIEWADRLGKLTPDEYLKVRLDVVGEGRRKISVRLRATDIKEF